MSGANAAIKQAAMDWFDCGWQRAERFGGYVLEQLQADGYHVVGTGAIKPRPTAPSDAETFGVVE